MPLDGIFLNRLTNELSALLTNGRVDKIHQPAKETLVVAIRAGGSNHRLLLCANASGPRLHLTALPQDNPQTPPMFCMLMRKRLTGAKLLEIRQLGLDRVVQLRFETTNDLGDRVVLTLSAEIMGRHSNVILIDENNKIIDAIKRVNTEMSRVRPILPGMDYTLAPGRERLDVRAATTAEICGRLSRTPELPLSKALGQVLEGMSPLICRELVHSACRQQDPPVSELDEEQLTRLKFYLARLSELLDTNTDVPTMLVDASGTPKDYSFMDINQYGHALATRGFENYSLLLDNFYSERDRMVRVHQRGGDLLKLLVNLTERTSKKLALQREELKTCGEREQLKIYGDLLSANLYSLEKGMNKASVQNFYDPQNGVVDIPLDIMLTPAQNAQKYYIAYRKADTAEKKLRTLIAQGEAELDYFDTVLDELSRAGLESELRAVREELAAQGYVRNNGKKYGKEERLMPLRYVSDDGFTILCGRNNLQNDKLTLKESRKNDLWLHTQKIPSAHVVVKSEGREIPPRTIEQAAIITVCNSKARDGGKTAVDYTEIRNVWKHPAGKPGLVLYDPYQTAVVAPDFDLAKRLLQK